MQEGTGVTNKAVEHKIRAERRLGGMLKAQKAITGLATGEQYGGKPTLAELGIDKKLSSRAPEIENPTMVAGFSLKPERDYIGFDRLS